MRDYYTKTIQPMPDKTPVFCDHCKWCGDADELLNADSPESGPVNVHKYCPDCDSSDTSRR